MLRISRWPRLWVPLEFSIIGVEQELGANLSLAYLALVSASPLFHLTFSAGFICALLHLFWIVPAGKIETAKIVCCAFCAIEGF